MNPYELIQSAEARLTILRAAEYTPVAELTALELQLAIAKCVYISTNYASDPNKVLPEPYDSKEF